MGEREQCEEDKVTYFLILTNNVQKLHYQGHCTTRKRLINRPQIKGIQSSPGFKVREN
jgi:hypothetical protein